MASIFTRIIEGEIPSYKIAEDERFYAFLDINPLARGHILVVPKVETDYLFDLDEDLLGEMMKFSKRIALAIDKTMDCKRVGVAVLGLEVPHAHIHLCPINDLYDIDFSKPKLKLSPDEFQEIAETIAKEVE
ncbi:MAG: HIT family protein [Bacteroidales bacterium]|nr:HIT family protein [Bacteroidales bacterium]